MINLDKSFSLGEWLLSEGCNQNRQDTSPPSILHQTQLAALRTRSLLSVKKAKPMREHSVHSMMHKLYPSTAATLRGSGNLPVSTQSPALLWEDVLGALYTLEYLSKVIRFLFLEQCGSLPHISSTSCAGPNPVPWISPVLMLIPSLPSPSYFIHAAKKQLKTWQHLAEPPGSA